MKTLINFIKRLKIILPLCKCEIRGLEVAIKTNNKYLTTCLNHLKSHIYSQYKILSCISGVDYIKRYNRFDVIFEMLSLKFNHRLRIKTEVKEGNSLNSSIFLYSSANWWEREIYDMFGIHFKNHNDLRRILTDYGFEDFPLRKDFPLSGYYELRYNEDKKVIVHENIQLSQEYKFFSFHAPWKL